MICVLLSRIELKPIVSLLFRTMSTNDFTIPTLSLFMTRYRRSITGCTRNDSLTGWHWRAYPTFSTDQNSIKHEFPRDLLHLFSHSWSISINSKGKNVPFDTCCYESIHKIISFNIHHQFEKVCLKHPLHLIVPLCRWEFFIQNLFN